MNILIDNIRGEVNYKNNLPTWNRQIDSSNSGGTKNTGWLQNMLKKGIFPQLDWDQDFTAIFAAFSEIQNLFTLFGWNKTHPRRKDFPHFFTYCPKSLFFYYSLQQCNILIKGLALLKKTTFEESKNENKGTVSVQA